MIGTFMFVLDFFIVNVALPAIQQGLRAGEGAIEWIVAGYAISTAVLLVTGGRLGDQFGRRRVFAIGMTVFVLTSAACALAPDPAVLVTARILQGVGAELMAPNILSFLGVAYSGPAIANTNNVQGTVTTPFSQPVTPVTSPGWTTFNAAPTKINNSATLTGGPRVNVRHQARGPDVRIHPELPFAILAGVLTVGGLNDGFAVPLKVVGDAEARDNR
jgi:MFS family permease